MPGQLTFKVVGDRPLIKVEVKPSLPHQQLLAANTPHTIPSDTVDFLIDTGAPFCVIEESVIATWRLRRNNPVSLQSGVKTSPTGWWYDLSLRLHTHAGNGWVHGVVPVASVVPGHYAGESFKGIIGMDILRLGSFKFEGATGTFSLWW